MANSDNMLIGDDSRLKKAAADARQDRAVADNERSGKDGTAFSAPERIVNFRDEWQASALPNPPAIPGYHLCWLSTTNTYDPIFKRMRMGYEPVKVEEVPGFEVYKEKSGEFVGAVSCNEMVLFKIRDDIYQQMMQFFHYEKPLEDEQMIRQNPALSDPQKRDVARPEEDGFSQLAKPVKPPASFA